MSKIQKIMVGSFYSKPNSKAKRKLLDHISESEVYHMMHSRFKTGLYFIFGADCNELKLDDILNLSPHLKQVVDKPTHNDKILDPIITDLHTYYQNPIIEKPLEADSDSDSASDHKMVLLVPLNTVDNKKKVEKKQIETQAFSEDNFLAMGRFLEASDWGFL